MDTAAADALVSGLKRAARSAKPWYFWFCPKGEDGAAVLLLSKKASALKKEARAARKTAKVKLDATGPVHVGADGLVFCDENEGKVPPARVQKLFKSQLAKAPELKKAAGLLRKATVVLASAFEPPVETDAVAASRVSDGFEGLKRDVEAALPAIEPEKVRKNLQKRFDKAVKLSQKKPEKAADSLEELLKELRGLAGAEAGADWDVLVAKAKAVHRDARERLGATSEDLARLELLRRRAIDARKADDPTAGSLLQTFIDEAEAAQPPDAASVQRAAVAADVAAIEVDADVTDLDPTPPTVDRLVGSWASAVLAARVEVARFKAAVLDHPGIRFDARFELVAEALVDFDPIPDFGDDLETALRGGNADEARTLALDLRDQIEVAPLLTALSNTALAPCEAATLLTRALDRIVAATSQEA